MIDGTSGYDFLNEINGLFIDSQHAERIHKLYEDFSGRHIPFDITRYTAKKLIMTTSF